MVFHTGTAMNDADLAKIYKPLYSWQTRLVELHPGGVKAELQCSLHIADVIVGEGFGLPALSRAQSYEAISYAWGQPERTASIRCNDQHLLVPSALLEALTALRFQSKARWLWCDAICIAQHDPHEKAAQVRMMFDIFSKADRTLAWLGAPTPELRRAFQHINNVAVSYAETFGTAHSRVEESLNVISRRSWFSRI